MVVDKNSLLAPLFQSSFELLENKNNDLYAKIILNEKGKCPFLNTEKLCKTHSNYGLDRLSNTCKTYPKHIFSVNNIFYQTGTISCPEMARVVLLNKNNATY
ncbi:flagellin lysine-N-methylase [Bacillus thuringiensis]|uniref:flagellin lysine-N-methylase n=1 Tax=Bacillus thuringiensis TaxID=1428 RepID=UPI003D02DF70